MFTVLSFQLVCLKFFIIRSWEEKTNDQQFILNIANGFSQIKKCGIYIVLKLKKKILKTFSCHDFPANSGNIKEISSLLQCSFHRRTKGSTREGKQGAHLHVFREVRSSGGQGTWGTLACWRGVKGRTTDWSPREEAVFITGPPSCFKTKTLRLSLDQKDYQ